MCKEDVITGDKRKTCIRPTPKNKLSKEEYQNILNKKEFIDLPLPQIVLTLADKGIYITSESTFYRILRKENLLTHRGKSKVPKKINKQTTFIATKPNQVWTLDITWLNTYNKGIYYKLYTIIDIFSRKLVGWGVWSEETGELALELVERALISEKVLEKSIVLHSDNSAPMKSHTLKSKLKFLRVLPYILS